MPDRFRFHWLVVVVFLAAATQGCISPSSPAVTPTAGVPPAVSPTKDVGLGGVGPLDLPDPAAGLAGLASYRAMLRIGFDGTQGGKVSQWSRTYNLAVTDKPAARLLSLEDSGLPQEEQLSGLVIAEVGGAAYRRTANGPRTASAVAQGMSSTVWEPAGTLPAVVGADKTGTDTINGVPANRYRFDQRATGDEGLATASGEVWVASQGGYVIKYTLTVEGGPTYFGEGAQGKVTWDYELTDANQPLTVKLPDDCPADMVDAPLLPDAASVVKMPSVVTYTTPTSLADAVTFYQEQLPAAGWRPPDQPVIGDMLAMLDFTQGNQQMSVIITAGAGRTTVRVVMGAAISLGVTETPTP